MLTVRCTRKLLKHLKTEVIPYEGRSPTTRLGDWYANLLFTRRHRLVACMSERTLLVVFVSAEDRSGFISRFRASIESVLWTLGIASESLHRELLEMDPIAIGSTANRSVLGSLNELVLQARFVLDERPQIDLASLAIELSDTPCSPLNYESPRSATQALLR